MGSGSESESDSEFEAVAVVIEKVARAGSPSSPPLLSFRLNYSLEEDDYC